ncbi:hypothetical protein IFM62136_05088 [Aspergillus lentulus]|nr:hypothetical protein IFM62136_05088 [Aspergillus lentulus]
MSAPLQTSTSPFALLLFEIFQKLTTTAGEFLVHTLSGGTSVTAPRSGFTVPEVTDYEVQSAMNSPFGISGHNQRLGGWCPQLPPTFSDYAALSYDDPAATRERRSMAKVSQPLSHSGIGGSESFFAGYDSISSEVQAIDSGLSSPSLHRGWQNPPSLRDGSSSLGPPS